MWNVGLTPKFWCVRFPFRVRTSGQFLVQPTKAHTRTAERCTHARHRAECFKRAESRDMQSWKPPRRPHPKILSKSPKRRRGETLPGKKPAPMSPGGLNNAPIGLKPKSCRENMCCIALPEYGAHRYNIETSGGLFRFSSNFSKSGCTKTPSFSRG